MPERWWNEWRKREGGGVTITEYNDMLTALDEVRSPDLDRGKFSADGSRLLREGKVFATFHWEHSHYDFVIAKKECEMMADYLNNSKRIPRRRQ